MKLKSITIQNIGIIGDTTIALNKPLLLFFGEIRNGKTTILNAVKWCFGGAFPTDIVRHGQAEAFVQLDFDNGSIRREWYRAKDGTTATRPLTFIKDGKPVKKPVEEIKRYLNPFILDQDYLRNMGELERKKYFVELFNVDTTDLDAEYRGCEEYAKELRAMIKGYGEIDLGEPPPAEDVTELKAELERVRRANRGIEAQWRANVDAVRQRNLKVASVEKLLADAAKEMDVIDAKIKALQVSRTLLERGSKADAEWLEQNPTQSEPAAPALSDTSTIEEKISAAAANAVRLEQYQKNEARALAKRKDEQRLIDQERRQREIKQEKVAKLLSIGDTSGIAGLAFDENGDFTYEGVAAGMLSTSQIMRLSAELSAMYPEGLSVELCDRAESLGTSVYEFVKRAEANDLTILATIVGEAPAKAPENVGVFVVKSGKVTAVS